MIFIAGHHNTGKTTLATWLRENYGFLHVETSTIVKNKHIREVPDTPFREWAEGKGHDYFNECIATEVTKYRELLVSNGNSSELIITGNRQMEGINHLASTVQPLPGTRHWTAYLEAPYEILFQRYVQRTDRPVLYRDFEGYMDNLISFDQEMGVERIKKHADVVLDSSCSMEVLKKRFARILLERNYSLIEGNNNHLGKERR